MSVTVQVLRDDARAKLDAFAGQLAPGRRGPLMRVLGRTLEKELRAWFAAADEAKANRRGWKRQHFWAAVRRRTAYDPARTTDVEAVVTIADPRVRPHVHGGTLRPKEAKSLAIPLRAEAYGVRPKSGVIAGLRFAPVGRTGNTVGYLVRREGDRVVNYYRLVRKVTVPRDPAALPPADLTSRALVEAARAFVMRAPPASASTP